MRFKDYLKNIGISIETYYSLMIEEQIQIYDTYKMLIATEDINEVYAERIEREL